MNQPAETTLQPSPSALALFPRWQAAVLLLLLAAVYFRVASKLVFDWYSDPNYSHGFFVPLIAAWVVWEKRAELRTLALRPAAMGLVGIIASLVILIGGVVGAELFLSRISLVFLLGSMIVYFLGWNWVRALLFPWLLLLTMVPIPTILFNEIAFPLQLLASRIAADLLSASGVPVLREGNVISLASIQLEVAEACSGIRSLMTLGTLALVYAYLTETRFLRRLILVVAGVPIALAANAFRIYGTGMCAQYWDPGKAEGFFHEFSGWVIFVLACLLLLLTHALLKLIWQGRRPA